MAKGWKLGEGDGRSWVYCIVFQTSRNGKQLLDIFFIPLLFNFLFFAADEKNINNKMRMMSWSGRS